MQLPRRAELSNSTMSAIKYPHPIPDLTCNVTHLDTLQHRFRQPALAVKLALP